jgi:tRNA(Ile)-lysidine synthase
MSVVIDALKKAQLDGLQLQVACSGGLDSVVLVHGLVELGYQPTILHINYQLRDEESEKDAQFVQALAQRLQLECTIVRCPQHLTVGPGINLQEAARRFRREYFQRWIRQSDQHNVVLAHHLNDQLETFFLQLSRGAGTLGLGGMHGAKDGLIRPFLALTKAELRDYATNNQLDWREDQSNQTLKYARNKLRLAILPDLFQQFPDLSESIGIFQTACRNYTYELETRLSATCHQFSNACAIPLESWNRFSEDEKHMCLKLLNWPSWTLNRINQLSDGALSTVFELNDIKVYRTKTSISWNQITQQKFGWDFKIQNVAFLPDSFSKSEVFLDPAKIEGTLQLRYAAVDDVIFPVGMQGKQLVSKALKDAGIPLQERNNYPILVDAQQVLWIPEIKIGKTALAQKESSNILKITLKKT